MKKYILYAGIIMTVFGNVSCNNLNNDKVIEKVVTIETTTNKKESNLSVKVQSEKEIIEEVNVFQADSSKLKSEVFNTKDIQGYWIILDDEMGTLTVSIEANNLFCFQGPCQSVARILLCDEFNLSNNYLILI